MAAVGKIEIERAKGGAIQIRLGDALDALAEVAYRRGYGTATLFLGGVLLVCALAVGFGLMTWRDLGRQAQLTSLTARVAAAELRALCAERQFDRVYETAAAWHQVDLRQGQRRCVEAEVARRSGP